MSLSNGGPWALPKGWTWATFADVAQVASNLVSPLEYPDLPHIAPNHIESETGRLLPFSTVAEDGVKSPKHRFSEGHILYSKIRPYLAKVIVARFDGLCSADMYPISTGLSRNYLALWLRSPEFTRFAAEHQGRSVLPKINKEALVRLPVPVPPLDEQRRIVAALDELLVQLAQANELLQKNLRKLSAYSELLLFHACNGRLLGLLGAPDQPAPPAADCSDGDLPLLPVGWTWSRLGEIADVVGGITKDAKKQSDPDLPEVPYLRVANVQRGYLDLSNVAAIRARRDKISALALQAGDVLLNEGGDRDKLGRGWIWEGQIEKCIHQNHVFRARVRDELLDPKILAWHANSFGRRWFAVNGKQSVNLASISLRKMEQFPVPIPPKAQQELIVREVERRLSVIENAETSVRAALGRVRVLRRSLLAEAFAGRLVPQDPNDEPADALLARIRAEREAAGAAKSPRRSPRGAPAQRKRTMRTAPMPDAPPPHRADASALAAATQPALDMEFPS